MSDLIDRQAAIDAAIEAVDEWDGGCNHIRADMIADAINNTVPSAQPEQDVEFWRKRAEEYWDQCIALMADMVKGVKFDSVCFNADGLVFKQERPEREPVEWIEHHEPNTWMGYTYWSCPNCGFECGYDKEIRIKTDFCPNCGVDMRGKHNDND